MEQMTSLFAVSREKALRGGEEALSFIKEKRREIFERRVDKLLRRRFFGPRSRKIAEEKVRRDIEKELFPDCDWNLWQDFNRAHTIVNACRLSNSETVYLSAKDASLIYRYLSEKETE